jgi:hypothetical protein
MYFCFHPAEDGQKRPLATQKETRSKAGSLNSIDESDYVGFRRIQPNRPRPEPNSQTAGGTGTGAVIDDSVRVMSLPVPPT